MEGFKRGDSEQYRQRIFQFININGPSLPIRIATKLGMESLIVSAYLAELLSEKEIKISYMRVGNSPLYYIKGQEFQLSEFANYLGSREKEAFEMLKQAGVLEDTKLSSVMRVALRSIKDFAIPVQNENKLFWKYLKINNERAMEVIQQGVPEIHVQRIEKKIELAPVVREMPVIERKLIEIEKPVEVKEKSILEEDKEAKEQVMEIKKPVEVKKAKKEKVKTKSEFIENVEKFLETENIQIIKEILSKKKDYSAIVRKKEGDDFINYLLIAKDKKSMTDKDLMKFLEAGKKDKLPVFAVSTGEPNKKASEWLDYFGEFFKFGKLG